jgi:hypothetical protein
MVAVAMAIAVTAATAAAAAAAEEVSGNFCVAGDLGWGQRGVMVGGGVLAKVNARGSECGVGGSGNGGEGVCRRRGQGGGTSSYLRNDPLILVVRLLYPWGSRSISPAFGDPLERENKRFPSARFSFSTQPTN